MKIVVFGPDKRIGVLQEDQVVDIAAAYAKYLGETDGKGQSGDVPSDLGQFIEGGDRTLECAQKTLDYLFGNAADHNGADGGTVGHGPWRHAENFRHHSACFIRDSSYKTGEGRKMILPPMASAEIGREGGR